MRARLALAATVVAAATLVPVVPSSAQACDTPLVNVLAAGEAAVSRPALRSPSEYALSNVYALNELATKPQFVYSEAGPQYAGAFEALAPPGSASPPRSVSGYPSEDQPDQHEEDWGGISTTSVTPTSAVATSTGAAAVGVGDLVLDGGRSFISTAVECETVTIIAGWQFTDVTLAPGLEFEQLGETVTIVVGPDGSSSDVEVHAIRAGEAVDLPIEGRPLDPFTNPMAAGGGPTVEVGEPRTETGDGFAKASGGGINVLQLDPETGQGAGYRLGSVEAAINVLGELAPPASDAPVDEPIESVVVPPPTGPTTTGVDSSQTGSPPPPAAAAEESLALELIRDTTSMTLEVTSRNWLLAWAFLALVVVGCAWGGVVAVGRNTYPTFDWIARRSADGAVRFVATYLRW